MHTPLQKLYLCDNYIEDERAESLVAMLVINCSLREVSLDRNSIGGEEVNKFAKALECNDLLFSLTLGGKHSGSQTQF